MGEVAPPANDNAPEGDIVLCWACGGEVFTVVLTCCTCGTPLDKPCNTNLKRPFVRG